MSDGPEVEVGMGVGSVRVESGSSGDTESEVHGVCVSEVVMYGRAQRREGERPRKAEWEVPANSPEAEWRVRAWCVERDARRSQMREEVGASRRACEVESGARAWSGLGGRRTEMEC